MPEFINAMHAYRYAQAMAPYGVSWHQKKKCWIPYDIISGAPEGAIPEFMTIALGHAPVGLSLEGTEVVRSFMENCLSRI